ncbi:alpha/beta fold hydrolase [Haloechinothrix sp. YIM 98757]|uniref:Alpha/beta fold hydrolase n=1 Tax=Haloechinothrix aidingensis TaxID=2752311 RepID=A0A838AEK9_9PSEU|nr:alpha/beta fold hydrolase [Haloechinothrix aidingensis]MBA0127764.1 alpha/beta fold hydrolase [Haloechinothrix aidingensis]
MTESLRFQVDGALLEGDLTVPDGVLGLVVFAHGSGSSRHSTRNKAVARQLQDRGLATVLFDLLHAEEEREDARTGRFRFDVALLTGRLIHVIDQVSTCDRARSLPLGLFGASTGAAVALLAAARRPDLVSAVVSRGGRPDLAGEEARQVRAPTLLIVGGRDEHVLELNQEAARRLVAPHEVRVVPGATHLFEEAGALDQVAEWAGEWFVGHGSGTRVAAG